uniref:PKD domain-containing protein n=1 Tax=Angiostrongylus cantonensis TaxID=6313 RepID=A0A0K0D3Q2_ANGCA
MEAFGQVDCCQLERKRKTNSYQRTLSLYFASCGANEFEYIEDPVFSMDISPPVGWTYFPQKSSDNYQIWYFVGQSNDSLIAKMRANNEIKASVSIHFPVENPTINTKGIGPLYGKVEGGAVTQTSPGGTGDFVFTAYTVMVRVTVDNAANTRYSWNIVRNAFMQKLSLNFNARFNGEVTISRS